LTSTSGAAYYWARGFLISPYRLSASIIGAGRQHWHHGGAAAPKRDNKRVWLALPLPPAHALRSRDRYRSGAGGINEPLSFANYRGR